MAERGNRLRETAEEQISELIDLLSRQDETVLRLPCPGREKLGDGTVGALASHTADNYLRIGAFVHATDARHAAGGHDDGMHDREHVPQNVGLSGLLERLSAGREALGGLASLSDGQLDLVPPAGSFRFCDGQRTLEQVLSSLLTHQAHQIGAIRANLS